MTTNTKLRRLFVRALVVSFALNTNCFCESKSPSLSGTYLCKVGRNESELYVKQLSQDKIQFALKTLWVGQIKVRGDNTHTGQSGGTVELKSGIGEYSHPVMKFKLRFSFAKNACTVVCTDCGGFGGVNVDPNGVYHRQSGKIPTNNDLDTYQ